MTLARGFFVHLVLAHVGHDHSRGEAVDETSEQTEEDAAIESAVPESVSGQVVPMAVDGSVNTAEPSSTVPTTFASVAEQATVGSSPKFSLGFGEVVFVVLLLLPSCLIMMKRRIHLK